MNLRSGCNMGELEEKKIYLSKVHTYEILNKRANSFKG